MYGRESSGTDTPVLDPKWIIQPDGLLFLHLLRPDSLDLLHVSLPTRESGHVGGQSRCFRVKASPGDTL